jgi:hypothetical protein
VHTKTATPIIPKTKNALFKVVDKFFIIDDETILKNIRYKETVVKNARSMHTKESKKYPSDLSLSTIPFAETN